MNEKLELALIIICTMVVIMVLWIHVFMPKEVEEAEFEFTCTNYTTETYHEFRTVVSCYIQVGNDTYDGICIELGETRNESMSHMTCICETENRTEGLYAWGGAKAYPNDIYWNYTVMDCMEDGRIIGTIMGVESGEFINKFGKFEEDENNKYIECPWNSNDICRLKIFDLPPLRIKS